MPADYSFDLTATGDALAVSRVRSLIDDVTIVGSPTEGTDFFLTDARILSLLEAAAALVTGAWATVYQASADALRTLSVNQAYVLKKKRTLGEDIDGPAVAASILKTANDYEANARRAVETSGSVAVATQYGAYAPQAVSW